MHIKKPFHKRELLFKDCESLVFLVSVDCDRMQEQVDHCLHPNDSHCYFKRADICWRVERGSFQRNDESPVLDCSERGPLEWIKMWHKGWNRRKKTLSNKSHLFCVASAFFQTLDFHSALCFALSVVSTVLISVYSFGKAGKRQRYPAAAAGFVTLAFNDRPGSGREVVSLRYETGDDLFWVRYCSSMCYYR